MATNVEIRRSNGLNFDEVVHLSTNINLVEGLLEGGKLNMGLMPDYVLQGMRFSGSLIQDTTIDELVTWALQNPFPGAYKICGKRLTITMYTEPDIPSNQEVGVIDFPDDMEEGDITQNNNFFTDITLEPGDWIVYNSVEPFTTNGPDSRLFKFAIVNNTYNNATTTNVGVVRLATNSEGESGLDNTKVMTPASTKAAITAQATPKNHIGTGGSTHATATQTTAGFLSHTDKKKLDGIAEGANKYTHPTFTGNTMSTLTGKSVISNINVNSNGHITQITTRDLTLADLGYTGATNANYYTHPSLYDSDQTLTPVDDNEFIHELFLNKEGHVTSYQTRTFPKSSTSQAGMIKLATQTDAIDGEDDTKATTPSKVKDMIDYFASIPLVTSLTGVDATVSGKLVMLVV